MKEAILISACLLGVRCRYDGGSKPQEPILRLMEKYTLIPVCPEQRMVTAKPHTFFLHVKTSNLMPPVGKFFISVGHFLIYQNTVAFRFHFFHEGVGILPHRRNQHLQSHWSLLPVFRP